MKTLICSFFASILFSSMAHAEADGSYHGVRCRTEDEIVQIQLTYTDNQPQALLWIEGDRVILLSDNVVENQQVAIGISSDGSLKYILNYDQGFYREVIKATGKATKDVRGLNCITF